MFDRARIVGRCEAVKASLRSLPPYRRFLCLSVHAATQERPRLVWSDRRPATKRVASILFPQRPSPAFFRRLRLCIAKQKSRRRPPSTLFRPRGVRADRPRSVDHHRGRDGRGPISRRKLRHGYDRLFHPHRRRFRSCAEKCPLAPLFEALARRRPGQAFPQRSEDNA